MSRSWVNLLRYPWRIRPWRAVVALILLVLTVRLVWGWCAGRQLEAALDAIRARGEPVEVADVVFVPLPDALVD